MLKIIPICADKSLVKACAKLLYQTWGEEKVNGIKFWEKWVEKSKEGTDNQHFAILNDKKVVGTFAIMHCDLRSRQELFPWMGNLVIDNKNFKEGIRCFALMRDYVYDLAKRLKIKVLYCYTVHNPLPYTRYGWENIGVDYDQHGNKITLMKLEIK